MSYNSPSTLSLKYGMVLVFISYKCSKLPCLRTLDLFCNSILGGDYSFQLIRLGIEKFKYFT